MSKYPNIPHPVVRSLFVQKELGERRGNWVTSLQEYDLEFKPASIVKRQGLCKQMTENEKNEEHAWEDEVELHVMEVCPLFTAPESWYRDLVHYLQAGLLPEHWSSKQRRALRLKSASYQLVEGVLFRKNYDGVLLRCLEKEDAKKVMSELHDGPTGGTLFRRHYGPQNPQSQLLLAYTLQGCTCTCQEM